jgi:hypothetical protein
MLKRLAAVLTVASVSAVLAVPATAPAATAKPKTRPFSVNFTAAALVPVANTDAGVTQGTFGKGAIVIVGATNGTVTTYSTKGTVTGKFALTLTPNPDNSATYTGKFTVTAGTGDFAGAKGTGTVSGAIAADGTVTGKATGKITF